MKIGILTYHAVANFGAQLQTASTVGYLKHQGHQPVVLDWYPADLEKRYRGQVPIEQFNTSIEFAKNVFPLSKRCTNEQELIKEVNRLNLDFIFVGSDALFKYQTIKSRRHFSFRKFRYEISPPKVSVEGLDNNAFFGGWLEKVGRKIPARVYAASCQNCHYQQLLNSEKERLKEYLLCYETISVRDSWTKGMIESITGLTNIKIYPDPVFGFKQNCIENIPSKQYILDKFSLPEHYMLLSFSHYLLKIEYINSLAQELINQGLYPVSLPMPERALEVQGAHLIKLPLSPFDWYGLIAYSDGYIGERMHPIVVALQSDVPFFSFDQYGVYRKKHWWSKSVFDKNASKTFLILKQADLLDNCYSLYGDKEIPSAKYVVEKVLDFDKKKCNIFSETQLAKYNQSMKEILV